MIMHEMSKMNLTDSYKLVLIGYFPKKYKVSQILLTATTYYQWKFGTPWRNFLDWDIFENFQLQKQL